MLRYYSQIVDYEAIGIKIAGLYSDAESAIDDIIKKPGIVITDINMPGMNGIDMIRTIKKQNNKSHFIILSGYDDYHLVKEAFKLGVTDYLLKSELEERDLINVLNDIMMADDALMQEKANRENTVKQFVWGNVFQNSDYGKINIKKNANVGICVAQIINYDDIMQQEWNGDKESLQYGTHNVISEIMFEHNECEFFFDAYDRIFFVISGDRTEAQSTAEKIAARVKDILKNIFEYEVKFGYVGVTSDRKTLKEYVTLAKKTAKYCFCTGKWMNIYAENQNKMQFVDCITKYNMFGVLVDSIGMQELVKFDDSIFPHSFSVKDVENVIDLYRNYLFSVRNIYVKYGLDYENITESFYYFYDSKQLTEMIKSRITDLNVQLRDGSNIMEVVKNYIKNNYSRDIDLTIIAKEFKINYFWLSRKFSEQFGTSFKKYLTEIRMKKSMNLIDNSNYKLKEISEMVGYYNYETFSKVFNKYFGKSPNEYIKTRKM